MSLIATAERLNTANQLKAWNDSCTSSMSSAKSTYNSIANQRVAMERNADYSDEDRAEVDAMLDKLNAIAKTLIAPAPVVTEATEEVEIPTIE